MAIVSIPFASIYLVPHVGGGAIVHAAGGYVANTLVPATVVEAFSAAAGVLAQVSGSASTLLSGTATVVSSPPVVLGLTVLAVAVGGYCYFNGIPAPVEAALAKAGLGSAGSKGFMISMPKLAVALVLVAGAGCVAFRFYRNFKAMRAAKAMEDTDQPFTIEAAREAANVTYGEEVWERYGAAVWSNMDSAMTAAVKTAQEAVSAVASTLGAIGSAVVVSAGAVRRRGSAVGSQIGHVAMTAYELAARWTQRWRFR